MSELEFSPLPVHAHPYRWRIARGGIQNVWHYLDQQFTFSGGRVIWRGVNGAGKSRALELLLPFLLDGDRRRMDSTLNGKVRLDDLMKAGHESGNRIGYLWLELERSTEEAAAEHLTLGALLRYATSTGETQVWYFNTPLRVGTDLALMDASRNPLSRADLTAAIGADHVTNVAARHADTVAATVFGLTGPQAEDRYGALLNLLYTLRDPDVGNRINDGKLTSILSAALPPLSADKLAAAGSQLDALSDTRTAQHGLAESHARVTTFLGTYNRYSARRVSGAAGQVMDGVGLVDTATAQLLADTADHTAALAQLVALEGDIARLGQEHKAANAALEAIKDSDRYRSARDLVDKEHGVRDKATGADRAWSRAYAAIDTARKAATAADRVAQNVTSQAAATDGALRNVDATAARAGVECHLPATALTASTSPVAVRTWNLRASHTDAPISVTVPGPSVVTLSVPDPAALRAAGEQAAAAGRVRKAAAAHRRTVAGQLQREADKVEGADQQAEARTGAAEQAAEHATGADRDRDTAAATLADQWSGWVAAAGADLLAGADWSITTLAPLLSDRTHLAGDPADVDTHRTDLDVLARAAAAAAAPTRAALASQCAALNVQRKALAEQAAGLDEEKQQLHAAHDAPPAPSPGRSTPVPGAVPLWKAVDFRPDLTEAQRAGLEGAMLAAGLLHGWVSPDGTLKAADGQVITRPDGPALSPCLADALTFDRSSDAAADLVDAVLHRIGLGAGTVHVHTDGTWATGPITGRHTLPAATYIGAAARAAARERRLTQIAAEEAGLAAADQQFAADEQVVNGRIKALDDLLASCPSPTGLVSARATATAAHIHADQIAAEAQRLTKAAQAARVAWATHAAEHADACTAAGLPTGFNELEDAIEEAGALEGAGDTLTREVRHLCTALGDLAEAQQSARDAAEAAGAAVEHADAEQSSWFAANAHVEALKATLGADAATILAEATSATSRRDAAATALDAATKQETLTKVAAGAAEARMNAARGQVEAQAAGLADAVGVLRTILDAPGVAAAAGVAHLTPPAPNDPAGRIAAATRPMCIPDEENSVSDRAMSAAVSNLAAQLAATYDVTTYPVEGVTVVELLDAAGPHDVTSAAAELARAVEEGQAALSDKEREVFTTFVVQGVGDELADRIRQARHLVDGMRASLAAIATVQGVRLAVDWKRRPELSGHVGELLTLLLTDRTMRDEQHDARLVGLLRVVVDAKAAQDPSAGYTEALTGALDYRSWHEMTVNVLGPEPGRSQAIGPRSKLSAGETRFVSYAVLFAAVDAMLNGLDESGTALRLVLLDDAFAKIDNQVVAQFLGLLVGLDLDFAMTGHGLWGTVPQVPALDVYEVRRDNGRAITTHVHWDGHTRHLRAVR